MPSTPVPRGTRPALLALLCLAALAGCGRSDAPGAAAPASAASGAAGAGAPVAVTTVRAVQRDLPVVIEATGTVTSVRSVDVKAQTSSLIAGVHVRDGQFVKAGDLLFTLDARADEAKVAQLRAQVTRSEAALADARRQLERSRDLLAQNFVSQSAVDTNQSLVDTQRAAVAADRAALQAAQVALSYNRIVAPLAGRVGSVPVSPGAAVIASQTTLVSITQVDPIEVSFSLPQRDLADVLAALQRGNAPVEAGLPESRVVAQGTLVFVDNGVDAATGTVKVKARFANPQAALWPGAFVRTRMTVRTLAGAVVIPQAAVVQGPRGNLVYVVAEGRAQARPVRLLATRGEDAAVEGVQAGDMVVLDGKQNLRPDARVVERSRPVAVPASGASRVSATGAAGASGATP